MKATMKILFALILTGLALPAFAADTYELPCTYAAVHGNGMDQHLQCAHRAQGKLVISPRHLKHMAFIHHGLAALAVEGQWYYMDHKGSLLDVITFDNGADPFSEGLIRSLDKGKIAYYDRHFKRVIGSSYDWGTRFIEGRAIVCRGCTLSPPGTDGHQVVTGGLWGAIDRRGKELEPLTYQSLKEVPTR